MCHSKPRRCPHNERKHLRTCSGDNKNCFDLHKLFCAFRALLICTTKRKIRTSAHFVNRSHELQKHLTFCFNSAMLGLLIGLHLHLHFGIGESRLKCILHSKQICKTKILVVYQNIISDAKECNLDAPELAFPIMLRTWIHS